MRSALYYPHTRIQSEELLKTAEALIKLEAREARLLGLDMPTRIEASGRDGAPLTIAVARQIIVEAERGVLQDVFRE